MLSLACELHCGLYFRRIVGRQEENRIGVQLSVKVVVVVVVVGVNLVRCSNCI